MMDNFFFIGLPYITLLLIICGSFYRLFWGFKSNFRKARWTVRGDFQWTTRSTGFFGRASIGPAALSIHWGIIILIIAHFVGFIGGGYNITSWVDFFRWAGLFGGIIFLYGLLWAFARRITIPQLRAMSTTEDFIVLGLLIIITSFGLYQSAIKLVFGVSHSVGPWLGSILRFSPDITTIKEAPLMNKLHIIVALIFFAYFPFTKLVHALSYPVGYITRSYITFRRYWALKK